MNLLILWKWLIYRNDYLMFYIAISIREEVVVICKRLYKSKKNVVIFMICSLNTRFFNCLDYVYMNLWFMKDLCISHPTVKLSWRYGISVFYHWQDVSNLWYIYKSVIEYQNKCFVGQKFYSLFWFLDIVALELHTCRGQWS